MTTATKAQVDEVTQLKTELGQLCRVIHDVGDFTHVINIKIEACDVSLKFQLTAAYPDKAPAGIMLNSKTIPLEALSDLQMMLVAKAKTMVGKAMISKLHELSSKWLEQEGFENMSTLGEERKGGKKKKKQRKPIEDRANKVDEKLASMRTSDDVIKRIIWDEALCKDHFSIGYLDRFLGTIEKNFGAFSWEDLASVDYDVLAVPKHRIQYFKYKEVKFWDKANRLDDMFGSTGSKRTIQDVIEQYERDHPNQNENAVAAATDDGADEDDGIVIHTGTEAEQEEYWQDKLRPNYFLCVRITDSEIQEGVIAMQDALLEVEPRYAECCIPPAALHITLCTLGLDNPTQIQAACHVLRTMESELKSIVQNHITLKMHGVTHFYNRVLYAKVHHSQDFLDFVNHLRVVLSKEGVEVRDNSEFVPHMTIMKTTRPVSRVMNTKEIDPSLYDHFCDMQFGNQIIDSIHLCSMSEMRQADGFYITPLTLNLLKEEL